MNCYITPYAKLARGHKSIQKGNEGIRSYRFVLLCNKITEASKFHISNLAGHEKQKKQAQIEPLRRIIT